LKKKEEDQLTLSYESDGKMGRKEDKLYSEEQKDGDEEFFFNTTQSSE
jgi:hypothetical protein